MVQSHIFYLESFTAILRLYSVFISEIVRALCNSDVNKINHFGKKQWVLPLIPNLQALSGMVQKQKLTNKPTEAQY